MRIHEMTEYRVPVCAIDSFGGSVEATAGGSPGGGAAVDVGGFDAAGNSAGAAGNGGNGISAGGSGDLGLGGPGPMETTAIEYAALGSIAGAGLLGAGYGSGWSGASLGVATAIASSYGVNLNTALGHLAHDIAASTAWGGVTALETGQ